jgi:hypothetical protein
MKTLEPVGIVKFERFFRSAAGIDVDKSDLKRYNDFVIQKVSDLLVRAQAVAKANGRDMIEPHDVPLTKGLRESIQNFKKLNQQINIQPILDYIIGQPQLKLACSEDTKAELPAIAGGLSFALARSFKIIDPELKNPDSWHWERAFSIFNLLL